MPSKTSKVPKREVTRGGWTPTGTSAARRANPSARTAKAVRTRQELVDAARRVFERIGYFDASVADIVREAGVAHGSFYTYFPSKQAVWVCVVAEVGRQVDEAVASSHDDQLGDAYEALDRSNRAFLDAYRANSAIIALIEQLATVDEESHALRLAGRQHHVERVANTIRRLQRRRVADPDIDPVTTAGALVAMLSNFAYWWFAGGDQYDADRATRTLTDIWARAIGLQRGPSRGRTAPAPRSGRGTARS
jgi:AcrR family transcriptional regulator